jgi:hypothetical protein
MILDMEGPIRMNQDRLLAKSISSPTASPWTASNTFDDEVPHDICRASLDTERPTHKNQDRLRAQIMSSLTASPRAAGNVGNDEALLDTCRANLDITMGIFEPAARIATCILEFQRSRCHKHLPATKITMSIFELAAVLVTRSPRSNKHKLSPSPVLRIQMLVASISSPRRTGSTSGRYP